MPCLGPQNQEEHVDNQGNPDLCLDGVLALPVEPLDVQVLFYHLEVELHTPALFVNGCDFQRVGIEHVRQERNLLSGLIVSGDDLTQRHVRGSKSRKDIILTVFVGNKRFMAVSTICAFISCSNGSDNSNSSSSSTAPAATVIIGTYTVSSSTAVITGTYEGKTESYTITTSDNWNTWILPLADDFNVTMIKQ